MFRTRPERDDDDASEQKNKSSRKCDALMMAWVSASYHYYSHTATAHRHALSGGSASTTTATVARFNSRVRWTRTQLALARPPSSSAGLVPACGPGLLGHAGARAFPTKWCVFLSREIRVYLDRRRRLSGQKASVVGHPAAGSGRTRRPYRTYCDGPYCRSSYFLCLSLLPSFDFQFFMAPRPCSLAQTYSLVSTHWSTGAGRGTRTVERPSRAARTSRSSESSIQIQAAAPAASRPCDDKIRYVPFHAVVRTHIRFVIYYGLV
jgi:hypothetical protein